MSRKIIVRKRAKQDMRSADAWYESHQEGLGLEVIEEINLAIRKLAERPNRNALYFGNLRRHLIRRFPFKIFYRTRGNTLYIVRVLHSKRDHTKLL